MTDTQRNRLEGYAYPELEVGFELEFFYAFVRKDIDTNLELSTKETSEITPILAQKYVRSILLHEKFEDANSNEETQETQNPSGFDDVVVAGHKPLTDYSRWQLAEDSSLNVTPRRLAAELNIPISEIENYHCAGMELISPPLSLLDTAWLDILEQVQSDLSSTTYGVGLNNQTTGLHIHFSLSEKEFPLPVLQSLVVLWALCEPLIDTLHPSHRRSTMNRYAKSVTVNHNYSLSGNFIDSIYAAATAEDLARCIRPTGLDGKYSKLNISNAKGTKPLTLEFREARGTLDSVEIRWWTVFCARMINLSCALAHVGERICSHGRPIPPQLLTLGHLFKLIGLEHEGRRYFYAKAKEYSVPEGDFDNDEEDLGE